MDPNAILPENLKDLDQDALDDLGRTIAEEGMALVDSEDELTDEQIDRIEQLSDAKEQIDAENSRRGDIAAERASKREAAAARFRGEGGPADAEVVDGEDVEVLDGEQIDEPVAAAAQPRLLEQPVLVSATGLSELAAATATAVAEALGNGAQATTKPRTPATRTAGQLSHMQPPRARAPRPERTAEDGFLRATDHAWNVKGGTEFADRMDVAKAITETHLRQGPTETGITRRIPIAQGQKTGFTHAIESDPFLNFSTMAHAGEEQEALVASGGTCAPLSPLYDFFRTQVAQSPVEDTLPVVQAPRGGIRFIVSPAYSQPSSGIGILCADGTKPVVHVPCPSTADETVCSVSQIIEFDNLQYRVFPEQVNDFLAMAAVVFAETKERHYLTEIDTTSTAVTAAEPYGTSRNLLWDWVTASVAYRKRAGMARGTVLDHFAPDWSLDAIKLDMAMDANQGLNYWDITDAQVTAKLASHGLRTTWYADRAAAATTQKFDAAQAAGALNRWPSTAVAYLHAPGTYVRLDAGSLDLGLVRDSILNGTNDLQLFYEEWIGMAKMGVESIKLTSAHVPNGTYPTGVTPMAS